MNTMDIEAIKPKIAELAKKRDLEFVALFGSQATGATHKRSDIDIAVLGSENLNLSKIIDDFYDLFKRDDVEVVNLGTASPTMMYVVVREGRALYEKEKDIFLNWKFYAIKIWMETAWLRELRDKKLIEWARNVG